MKRLIITAISFLFFCLGCFAQDINGLDICKKRTKSEFIQLFGQPKDYSKYTPAKGDDGLGLGYTESYEFDGIWIDYSEKIGIYSYGISSPDYHVLTDIVSAEGIKVGDNLSKLDNYLKYLSKPEYITSGPMKGAYVSDFIQWEGTMIFDVVNGKITCIAYQFPL